MGMRKFYKFNMTTKEIVLVDGRNIKKGDIFRINEPDGIPVTVNGNFHYIAYENAKRLKKQDGYTSISCFSIPNDEFNQIWGPRYIMPLNKRREK